VVVGAAEPESVVVGAEEEGLFEAESELEPQAVSTAASPTPPAAVTTPRRVGGTGNPEVSGISRILSTRETGWRHIAVRQRAVTRERSYG
jgi:hypothetical protein